MVIITNQNTEMILFSHKANKALGEQVETERKWKRFGRKTKKTICLCADSRAADPDSLPFLDRVVADSRSIGLYHTSGLSTPSQVFMDMLALSHLIYAAKGEEDPYIRLANDTVHERYEALMNALGLTPDESASNTQYYTLIDVYGLVEQEYGPEFLQWLKAEKTEIDFLNDLAGRKGVVLMYGPGFSAPDGTVRVSLANLNTEDYVEIARRLFELLDEYYAESEIGLASAA